MLQGRAPRCPRSGPPRKTTQASAVVVARLAVARCTPGSRPERFASATKRKRLPESATRCGVLRPTTSVTMSSSHSTVSKASTAGAPSGRRRTAAAKPMPATTRQIVTASDDSIVSVTGNTPTRKSTDSPKIAHVERLQPSPCAARIALQAKMDPQVTPANSSSSVNTTPLAKRRSRYQPRSAPPRDRQRDRPTDRTEQRQGSPEGCVRQSPAERGAAHRARLHGACPGAHRRARAPAVSPWPVRWAAPQRASLVLRRSRVRPARLPA